MTDHGSFAVSPLLETVATQGAQKGFGWSALDSLEIGFNPGELAIIAGRTGHGKTTVLFNILMHWLETYTDEHFVLFSHEIPAESVLLKLLSALTRKMGGLGWSYHDIRRWTRGQVDGAGEDLDIAQLEEAVRVVRGWQDRVLVLYEPDWNVVEVANFVRGIGGRSTRMGGIMVDYLGLVQPPPGRYEDREHEVTAVARELKRLGVELRCPSVVAAQIGTEAARLTDWVPDGSLEDEKVLRAIAKRRPQLHHLQQGGGIQEADLVIGILNYRADYLAAAEESGLDQRALLEEGRSGPFEVSILKNRFGLLSIASLVLEARTGYIRDAGVFGR